MLYVLDFGEKMIYRYHFTTKSIYPCTYHALSMGGVLERIMLPFVGRQLGKPCVPLHGSRIDIMSLQLETAKEILGEVFSAPSSEVDEMIRQRISER